MRLPELTDGAGGITPTPPPPPTTPTTPTPPTPPVLQPTAPTPPENLGAPVEEEGMSLAAGEQDDEILAMFYGERYGLSTTTNATVEGCKTFMRFGAFEVDLTGQNLDSIRIYIEGADRELAHGDKIVVSEADAVTLETLPYLTKIEDATIKVSLT